MLEDVEGNASPKAIGRYLLFAPFAEGGMASVHLGRILGESGFSRLVALKRPHLRFASSANEASLFHEARLSSRIRHPNVIETLDVIRDTDSLLLVMQYVHGVSLSTLLAASRRLATPLPLEIVSSIFVDFLRGLHAAHEARAEDGTPLGIVHRDVSPQNMLVGTDGITRVLDFGVAKALRQEQLTMSGELKGKLAYMAPEQVRGETVNRKADLFVTGVVLWEALTLQKLFSREELGAVVLQIMSHVEPKPLMRADGTLHPFNTILTRALKPQLRDRFGTAEEMALAIADACPPASPSDVARFVEYVASDELEARDAQVRVVENFRVVPRHSAEAEATTQRAHFARLPSMRRVYTAHKAVLALTALTVLCAIVLLSLRQKAPLPLATSAVSMTAASANGSTPSPAATSPATSEVEALATLEAPVDVVDLDTIAPPAPTSRVRPHPRTPPRPRTSLHPPSCDPPYSVDDKGMKHYKPECLP
jgi:serine/threonine-protein kinase